MINEKIGVYNKKEEVFKINGGGSVWFRTGTDPDSVVGITNVRAVLCDEAGLYSRYFWDNIQARASFREAPIMIVTSPYSLNWLYTDFIRKHRNGDPYVRELVELVQATSKDNPYFPDKEYEDRRRTMDPRRFNMIYGGEFGKAEGLVYDCFDTDSCVVEPFKLPEYTRYIAGVDWGYTDPFVISVRAITPDGDHYRVGEFYRTKMTLDQMIDAARRFSGLWPIERWECDPSRPEYIVAFCQAGLKAVGAQNDIRLGIDLHYELINRGNYKIFSGTSPHAIDEYEQYHYPEPKDLKPDQGVKDMLPVDQANHCMDTERYITIRTFNIGKKKNRVIIEKDKPTKSAYVPFDKDREKLLKRSKNWDFIE